MTTDRRLFIKVGVDMPDHPKIEALSDRAFRHLFRLWTWCWKHDTDGEITPARWRQLPPKVRHELVTCDLIDEVGGVLIVHDYLEHQQSSEERQQASGRQSKGGSLAMHNRWHTARGVIKQGCSFCDSEASSTRDSTHKPPYNPGNKVSITEKEKEKELRDLSSQVPVSSAHARTLRGASGPNSTTAFRLVERTLGRTLTSATKTALAIQVATLMAEVDESTLSAALKRWDSRTGIGAALLPGLVDDIRKEARGATNRPANSNGFQSQTDANILAFLGKTGTDSNVLQLPRGES